MMLAGVVVIPYRHEKLRIYAMPIRSTRTSGFGQGAPGDKQRKGLPLPLEDSGNATDSIPTFAPQTPVSQEIIVQQIANRLRHDHIRFAGIVGTDVLDVLFISRFLRAETPDTRPCSCSRPTFCWSTQPMRFRLKAFSP